MRTRYLAASAAAVGILAATPVGPAVVAGAQAAVTHHHSSTDGSRIVAQARRYLGVPYVWGGETRAGMDCSGFTMVVFRDLGEHLPRTAAEQQHAGTAVHGLGNARAGDLLFWDYGGGDHHVAIYEGNGRLVEAPQPGTVVSERNVYSGVIAIRRITT